MSVENLNGQSERTGRDKMLLGNPFSDPLVVPFALSLWSLPLQYARAACGPLDNPPAPHRSKIWLPRALSFDTSRGKHFHPAEIFWRLGREPANHEDDIEIESIGTALILIVSSMRWTRPVSAHRWQNGCCPPSPKLAFLPTYLSHGKSFSLLCLPTMAERMHRPIRNLPFI